MSPNTRTGFRAASWLIMTENIHLLKTSQFEMKGNDFDLRVPVGVLLHHVCDLQKYQVCWDWDFQWNWNGSAMCGSLLASLSGRMTDMFAISTRSTQWLSVWVRKFFLRDLKDFYALHLSCSSRYVWCKCFASFPWRISQNMYMYTYTSLCMWIHLDNQ